MTEQSRAWQFAPAWWFSALYVVLLLCIPTRLIVGPIGAPGTPANLLAMAGLLWWCCALAAGLVQVRGITPLRATLGIFAACALVSYAMGHAGGWYQPADIHQRSDRLWEQANVTQVTETVGSASDRGLLALAGWLGILLVTSEGIRTWEQLEKLIGWVVGAGTVVASMGILQYFTGLNVAAWIRIPGLQGLTTFGNALSRSELNRIVSTAAHPIELGVALASLLPFALHRSLHAKRWTGWIPTGLIGIAALMSVSRSAVVVAGLAMVIMFLGWPWKWRIIAVVAFPFGALAARAALPGLLGTVRALFTNLGNDPSISGRTDDYPLVFRMVAEQPLFGQGLFTWVPMVYRTIDNQGLMLLLEIGIVGTAALACLFATAAVIAWSPRWRGGDARKRHLGLAVSAALIGIVSSFLTFDALSFRQVAGLTFFYVGLAGAVWQVSRRSVSASSSPAASPAASPAPAGTPDPTPGTGHQPAPTP